MLSLRAAAAQGLSRGAVTGTVTARIIDLRASCRFTYTHTAQVTCGLELRNKESHLQKVKDLFNRLGAETSGSITYLMFEEKINSPEVREYFQSLGLEA